MKCLVRLEASQGQVAFHRGLKQKPGSSYPGQREAEGRAIQAQRGEVGPQLKEQARAVRDRNGQDGQAQSKVGSGVRWG